MNTRTTSTVSLFCSLAAILLLGGCIGIDRDVEIGDGETADRTLSTVNGSVRVGADSTVQGDAETVNGSVSIGPRSRVAGTVETVNGKIELGEGAAAGNISVVNGPIQLGSGARVEGTVETVNGRVVLGADAIVVGEVTAVNGQILLEGATAGSLTNVSGGIVLEQGSRVLGELRVIAPRLGRAKGPVTVIIHADCEVGGPLVFERPVTLRIHESAVVGEIQGAEPEYFSD